MGFSRAKARWVVILSCTLLSSLHASTATETSNYIFQVWQTDQGLPENSATAMVQTPDGYLWFGTFDGLVRFDGVKFTVFDRSNTPELPSQGIVNLYLDRSARLWVSTMQGTAYVKDGSWRVFHEDDGWLGNYVWRFVETRSGDLYLTTFDHKLLRFNGDRFQQITPPPVSRPDLGYQLFIGKEDALWVIHPQFIGRFVNGQWEEMIPTLPLVGTIRPARRPSLMPASSPDGGLWLATEQSLRKYDGTRLVFETHPPWKMASLWSMHEDSNGGIWITSSADGLYHYSSEDGWQHFTMKNGLSYHAIRFVFEDREHNLWVGTSGGGLERFKRRNLVNWGPEQGLTERVVKSVTVDSQNRMYFGTFGNGVFRLEGSKITQFLGDHDVTRISPDDTCHKFFDGLVTSTLADSKGRLWIGSFSTGLYVVDNNKCIGFFASAGNSPRATPLFEDSHRRVWLDADGGALVFEGTRFKEHLLEGAPEHSHARAMAEDVDRGIFWAGNAIGGLYRLNADKFVPVTEARAIAHEHISTLLSDKDGTLWIGTEEGGIACLRNRHLTKITEADGLPARSIASILDDGTGNLWFGSNRGILRASRNQLDGFIAGKKNRVEFQVFDQNDGMLTTQCSIDSQTTGVQDHLGRLWFATFKGAVMADPKTLRLNTQPPPLAIEQILIDDKPIASQPQFATFTKQRQISATIPPGDHHVEIHYAALSFTAPEKVRFRTMLSGFDRGWIDVGNRRTAYMQHMKAGKYQLWIKAANNDGVWNEAGISAFIEFKPHFYETYWFYASCIFATLVLGVGIQRRRLRGLEEQALRLTDLVNKRTGDLIKQRAFLQHVLDINPNFIFAKDREGRFTLVNDALASYFRARPADLIGKTDAEIQPHRPEADAFRHDDLEVMNTLREKVISEEPLTDAEGKLHWLQTVKRPIVGEDGIANQVLGVAVDITERKRTEEELRRREADYRRLVEDIPEVVWRTDENGNVLLISGKIVEVFGYGLEKIYREGAKLWFGCMHADDRDRVREAYSKLFHENQVFDVEYRIQHADGHWMWWHDRAVAIEGDVKRRRVAEGLISDISARKVAEEELRQHREHLEEEVSRRTAELRQTNAQLLQEISERQKLEEQLRQAQKMEAVGTLSGGIAHDFNNLLTVIKGYAGMLIKRVRHDPELRSQVEQIDEAAERAASLTNQLLAFSRRQVLQPKIIDLNSLIVNLEQMLQRLIGEDVEVIFVPEANLGTVMADPGQMEQVIMNLVVNARDAMPNGGKVTLETANVVLDQNYARDHVGVNPGRYVMLAVSDNGVGMDQETLSHVFEPFFTTKEKGRGTGLGLSMAYGIVKQSDGHIWVYSEPGRGTTFKIYLPLVGKGSLEPATEEVPTATLHGRGTILLVEDDRQVRELACSILRDYGYTVIPADSTRMALEVFDDHIGDINLLLTDVVMPGLSGRELANQITARMPKVKVLYMSGYTTNAIVHHGVLDAGTFFLQKPFTPESLGVKVSEILHPGSNILAPHVAPSGSG